MFEQSPREFIPLDIFKKKQHNGPITNKVEAWLTFFGMDSPEDIVKLITAYPEFKPMYEDVYRLCLNMEKVMDMFSKELQILDENTVQYMMDEMQETINEQQGMIDEQQGMIDEQRETIDEQQGTIDELAKSLDEKDNMIRMLQERLQETGK